MSVSPQAPGEGEPSRSEPVVRREARASSWPPPELVESLLREVGGASGRVAIVLGSGLGRIADRLKDSWTRGASEIPGYPASTVAGHEGRLLCGGFGGRRIWVVQGRVHLYEGYSAEEVTRPTRLLHALGVRILLLTNAAGSADRAIAPGEIVLASDAMNFFFRPLARPRTEPHFAPSDPVSGTASELWARRPPLVDPELFATAGRVARDLAVPLRTGILVGSSGPNYETASEIALWRRLGGSVASMSTVPEAVEARELGMRCLLFSLVTNYGTGLSAEPLTHTEVIQRADSAAANLAALLEALVGRLETGESAS